MSTSASNGQMIKAPLQVFGLEGRYATALYSAASKLKTLEAAEKDLISLQAQMKKDVNFKDLLKNPTIQRKAMMSALIDVGQKAQLSAATTNLLATLAENGRLKRLDGVINAFRSIMAAHRGEVVCEVISAKPLEAGQKTKLEGALKVRKAITIMDKKFDLILFFTGIPFSQSNNSHHISC